MRKFVGEEEIKQFLCDQLEIVEQYCKVYNVSRQKLLSQTWVKAGGESIEIREKNFLEKIISDPIGLFTIRILFVVYTPPEDFSRRLELYKISDPIEDHHQLCTLTLALRGSNWESYFRNLAHNFMVIAVVDLQKHLGREGTVTNLRRNYERITMLDDGTEKREIDLWPKAKVLVLVKPIQNKVESHFYPVREESLSKFSNWVDEGMINWMQCLYDPELRDDAYGFQKGGPEVFIFLYDLNVTP